MLKLPTIPSKAARCALAATLAAALIPLAAIPALADETLPTKIVNGGFDYPATAQMAGWKAVDGNDTYITQDGRYWITSKQCGAEYNTAWHTIENFDAALLGWKSTEPAYDTGPDGGTPAQSVQINYDNQGQNAYGEIGITLAGHAIYQDIATSPGSVYKWRLKHSSLSSKHDDAMEVRIGEPGDESAQEARRITSNGTGTIGPVGTEIKTHNIDADGVYANSWETYTGSYIVPEGQTTTRFTFKATSWEGTGGGGNNIDDVSFAKYDPLVYDLNGGQSDEIVTDLDAAQADGYASYFEEDVAHALTAVKPAREGYTFLGWSESKLADVASKAAYDNIAASITSSTIIREGLNVVHAVWGKVPTVTFTDGFGDELKVEQPAFGSAVTPPSDPEREGYSFAGWTEDADEVYEDADIEALWRAHEYDVEFRPNGGTGEALTQHMTYDQPANLDANTFTKDDHTWVRWCTTPTGTGRSFEDEESVMNLTAEDGGKVVLYAQWVKSPTVTYEDGFGEVLKVTQIPSGTAPVPPQTPSRAGYVFCGWSDAGERVTDDVTVFAQWRPIAYTLEYDANGATGVMDAVDLTYDEQVTLTRNGFKRVGYTFEGWNTEPDGTGEAFEAGEKAGNLTEEDGATVTLYAQWEPISYTIAFDANGGTGEMEDMAMTYGASAKLTANAYEFPGHTFAGWALSPTGALMYADKGTVRNRTTEAGATVTLYAVWSESAEVCIEYAPADPDMCDVTLGSESLLPASGVAVGSVAIPKPGYKFSHWETAEGDVAYTTDAIKPEREADGLFHAVTYYAVCEPVRYAIAYDANGGEGEMPRTDAVFGRNARISDNGFTRPGYVFIGWSTERSNQGDAYAPGQRVHDLCTEDGGIITLYAQWVADAYRVIFDANGGEGEMEPHEHLYSQTEGIPECTFGRQGHAFAGWNTKADGSGTTYLTGQVIDGFGADVREITLYAQWVACPYNVAYDGNGGFGMMAPERARFGEDLTLAPSRFYRDGYSFAGWNTEPDGTGAAFEECGVVRDLTDEHNGTVTLYAQWAPMIHKVTFTDGYGNVLAVVKVEHGGSVTGPDPGTREGFVFDGWDKAKDLGNVTDDMTCEAMWLDARVHHGWNGAAIASEGKTALASTGAAYDKTSDTGAGIAALAVFMAGVGAMVLGRQRRREEAE